MIEKTSVRCRLIVENRQLDNLARHDLTKFNTCNQVTHFLDEKYNKRDSFYKIDNWHCYEFRSGDRLLVM